MNRQNFHMRDQKANQVAMSVKLNRQAAINLAEELTMVAVLWGMFFLATLS